MVKMRLMYSKFKNNKELIKKEKLNPMMIAYIAIGLSFCKWKFPQRTIVSVVQSIGIGLCLGQ